MLNLFRFRKAHADGVEPFMNYKYLVEITGGVNFARAGFTSVSGLKATVEEIQYREGGDNLTPRSYPGMVNYDPLVLSRGMTKDLDAFNAFKKLGDAVAVNNSNLSESRLNIVITLQDRRGNPVKTWTITNAWMSSYEVSDLNADSQEAVIETMEFRHEGFI